MSPVSTHGGILICCHSFGQIIGPDIKQFRMWREVLHDQIQYLKQLTPHFEVKLGIDCMDCDGFGS